MGEFWGTVREELVTEVFWIVLGILIGTILNIIFRRVVKMYRRNRRKKKWS